MEQEATLGIDATILQSNKMEAAVNYEGEKGYQPVVVVWAEQDLIVHDQFLDGNVPAGCGNAVIIQKAIEAFPQGVTKISLRADSALDENKAMSYCEDRGIEYAISAGVSFPIRRTISK